MMSPQLGGYNGQQQRPFQPMSPGVHSQQVSPLPGQQQLGHGQPGQYQQYQEYQGPPGQMGIQQPRQTSYGVPTANGLESQMAGMGLATGAPDQGRFVGFLYALQHAYFEC